MECGLPRILRNKWTTVGHGEENLELSMFKQGHNPDQSWSHCRLEGLRVSELQMFLCPKMNSATCFEVVVVRGDTQCRKRIQLI